MGGSKPSRPTVVMPTPTAPTMYQSVTPLESYQDLAEQLKRIQTETGKIQEQRYQEVGTPAELGALQAGRRARESAAYLSAIPKGDKYLQETTGVFDPYKPIRETVEGELTESQKAYAEAMQKVGTKPEPTITETPSWAKRTIT